MRQILIAIKNRYGDIPVFITENGVSDFGHTEDVERITYHRVGNRIRIKIRQLVINIISKKFNLSRRIICKKLKLR